MPEGTTTATSDCDAGQNAAWPTPISPIASDAAAGELTKPSSALPTTWVARASSCTRRGPNRSMIVPAGPSSSSATAAGTARIRPTVSSGMPRTSCR